jgi:hypothetical protein
MTELARPYFGNTFMWDSWMADRVKGSLRPYPKSATTIISIW